MDHEMKKVFDSIRIDTGNAFHKNLWPSPLLLDDVVLNRGETPFLTRAENKDILTLLAVAAAKQVQFPLNTAYLHGLGVVASAMNKSFDVETYSGGDTSPVSLFVVTSQPPSSGKSAINRVFSNPVSFAYDALNKKNAPERIRIDNKLKSAYLELKSANSDAESLALSNEIAALTEQLALVPKYKYIVTNATAEGLEKRIAAQNGIWQLVSDEAGSIMSLLGLVYGIKGAAKNSDIVLQGWDGDWMSVERVTRDGYEGYVRGSIAVIAQKMTISAILEAGNDGNGVSERFLLLDEPEMIGHRSFINEDGTTAEYHPIPSDLRQKYQMLVSKIVHSDKTTLQVSDKARNLVARFRQGLEPEFLPGRKNSNTMLRGAVGKADKQIYKIAAVLHVVENWCSDSKPIKIKDKSVEYAIDIFSQLSNCYRIAADNQGVLGDRTEAKEVGKSLLRMATRKRPKFYTDAKTLRSNLKGRGAFKLQDTLTTKHIAEIIIPNLVKARYCIMVDDVIYINPNIDEIEE